MNKLASFALCLVQIKRPLTAEIFNVGVVLKCKATDTVAFRRIADTTGLTKTINALDEKYLEYYLGVAEDQAPSFFDSRQPEVYISAEIVVTKPKSFRYAGSIAKAAEAAFASFVSLRGSLEPITQDATAQTG